MVRAIARFQSMIRASFQRYPGQTDATPQQSLGPPRRARLIPLASKRSLELGDLLPALCTPAHAGTDAAPPARRRFAPSPSCHDVAHPSYARAPLARCHRLGRSAWFLLLRGALHRHLRPSALPSISRSPYSSSRLPVLGQLRTFRGGSAEDAGSVFVESSALALGDVSSVVQFRLDILVAANLRAHWLPPFAFSTASYAARPS